MLVGIAAGGPLLKNSPVGLGPTCYVDALIALPSNQTIGDIGQGCALGEQAHLGNHFPALGSTLPFQLHARRSDIVEVFELDVYSLVSLKKLAKSGVNGNSQPSTLALFTRAAHGSFLRLIASFKALNATSREVIDSSPVFVCRHSRIQICDLLPGKTYHGYNESKKESFMASNGAARRCR